MTQLVSCATDLKIFNVPSYQLLHSYDPFKLGNKIKNVSLSIPTANSQYIVSVSSQKGIAEIASVSQNGISKMGNVRNFDSPSAASFGNTTHRYLAMGSSKGTVAIYDLKTKNFQKYFETLKSSISHLQYNFNDSYLAAGCENGEIVVFSTVKNIKSSTLTVVGKNPSVSALRFHSVTKQFLAAGDHNGSVAVWDINIHKPKLSLNSVHNSTCTDIAFSPLNAQLVVTVSYDKHINCYDITSNSKVFSKKLDQVLSSLDFHPDGNSVAVGSYAGNIYTIDFRNNFKIVDTIEAHEGEIHTLLYKTSKNDMKSSKNDLSFVYQSLKSASSRHSSPIVNDSFINITGSTQQEDNSSETNDLSALSTNSSILDVMGLSEPVYEDEVGLSPIPVREKSENDSKPGNCIQRTENSNELSFNLSVQIENRESQVVQLVENNLQENNNYPESITPIAHTDNSDVLLAVNRLKTSVNANIDEVLNVVQNMNYRMIELAENVRVQDIYMKMEIIKRFLKQEDRLDAIHHNLLNEIYKLREENANLRNDLALNKHNNC